MLLALGAAYKVYKSFKLQCNFGKMINVVPTVLVNWNLGFLE